VLTQHLVGDAGLADARVPAAAGARWKNRGVSNPANFYEEVGAAPVSEKIVARFFEEVRPDEILRPLYPEEDLGPAEVRLRMRHARRGFVQVGVGLKLGRVLDAVLLQRAL
jgi:hypothetical protein